MALMKCPECGLQVSDKALSCPHCGYPLDSAVKKKKGRGPAAKRKRLPQHHRNKRKEFARTLQSTSMCGAGSIGTIYSKIFETENFFQNL